MRCVCLCNRGAFVCTKTHESPSEFCGSPQTVVLWLIAICGAHAVLGGSALCSASVMWAIPMRYGMELAPNRIAWNGDLKLMTYGC